MHHEVILILGIPIDNLTMDETVDQIFNMINTYELDERPKLVATVNVDFLVNTLKWFSRKPRHPELLDILRRANLVTADGMPLIWLSKLIGTPLKERVAGADLVPRLAKEAAKQNKSIYFLGGSGDVGKQAAEILKRKNKDLIIAGTNSPFVHVQGEEIEYAHNTDLQIVDRINKSGADILLIAFGNPKQEIWFQRNKNQIKTAVTIGIGGTFEFITGSVSRAPTWMQKFGLEWIFRITQDPKRLWKRYFIGLLKFSFMILPVICYYKYRRFLFKFSKKDKISEKKFQSIKSTGSTDSSIRALKLQIIKNTGPTDSSIRAITLPNLFDASTVEQIRDEMQKIVRLNSNIVLDFEEVNFIDSSGLGYIVRLWRLAQKEKKGLYITGIKQSAKRVFKLTRVIDLFKDKICSDSSEVINKIQESSKSPFYYLVHTKKDYTMVSLFGTLDADQMQIIDLKRVFDNIQDSNCILDLTKLTFVDSSGVMFFLKINKHVLKHNKTCILFGLQDNVRQMFKIIRLIKLFKITDTFHNAEKMLNA